MILEIIKDSQQLISLVLGCLSYQCIPGSALVMYGGNSQDKKRERRVDIINGSKDKNIQQVHSFYFAIHQNRGIDKTMM